MISRHPTHFSAPLAAFVTVALATFWIIFAPTALGGQSIYVIVSGNSMEPLYHQGDLIILRLTNQAQIGDIFAYRYPQLGTVIHRIVGRDGERYIFQGDHNSWRDGYHPEQNDLVGKAWLQIASIGRALLWLRQPLVVALLTGVIGGLLMFGFVFGSSGQPGSNKKNKGEKAPWKFLRSLPEFPLDQNVVLFSLSLLLFLGAALAVLAFSKPVTQTVENNIVYTHSANYRYSAPADPKVYDQAVIQSGEPVFSQLTCKLNLTVDYAITSPESADISGSYKMFVLTSEFNGWKRTIELLPATTFQGRSFHAVGILNVCAIRRMLDEVISLTGLIRSTYNVSVITQINLAGQIGGRAYEEKIAPSLNFALDGAQLYIARDDLSGSDPFNWKKEGLIPRTREEANTIPILRLNLPVLSARIISILSILIALAGLIAYGLPLLREARQNDLAAIRLKYAHLLIQMDERSSKRPDASAQKIIDVKSMTDLARLAQNSGVLIMEKVVKKEHHFLVLGEPYSYRYILRIEQQDHSDAL